MMLYKRVELVEGEPVLFVGVHILRWRFNEWGEPTFACVEAEPDDKDATIAQLRADLEAMTKQRNTLLVAGLKARAIIAPFREQDDADAETTLKIIYIILEAAIAGIDKSYAMPGIDPAKGGDNAAI